MLGLGCSSSVPRYAFISSAPLARGLHAAPHASRSLSMRSRRHHQNDAICFRIQDVRALLGMTEARESVHVMRRCAHSRAVILPKAMPDQSCMVWIYACEQQLSRLKLMCRQQDFAHIDSYPEGCAAPSSVLRAGQPSDAN